MNDFLCGIYCIRNKINKKLYIGQASNLRERKIHHFNHLNNNKHDSPHLQNAWNKYKNDSFEFKVLLYCEPFELTRYEQFFVNSYPRKMIYNIRLQCVDTNLGIKYSEDIKKKLSKSSPRLSGKNHSQYGKHRSDETKKKLRDANIGKKSKRASSSYFGVCLQGKRWVACLHTSEKSIYIGSFEKEMDAGKAYDRYVTKNNLNRPLNFLQNNASKETSI